MGDKDSPFPQKPLFLDEPFLSRITRNAGIEDNPPPALTDWRSTL